MNEPQWAPSTPRIDRARGAADLHLLRLVVNGRELQRSVQRSDPRMAPRYRHTDYGTVLHTFFARLLPPTHQPLTFRMLDGSRGRLELAAYTHQPLDELRAASEANAVARMRFGDAAAAAACAAMLWHEAEQDRVEIPAAGTTVQIEVRCAMLRRAWNGCSSEERRQRREYDPAIEARQAILQRREAGELSDLEARVAIEAARVRAYRAWFSERLRGAELLQGATAGGDDEASDFAVRSFRMVRSTRNDHRPDRPDREGPKERSIPTADLSAVVRITDTRAFEEMITSGIGRQRAFGYAMPLFRPLHA